MNFEEGYPKVPDHKGAHVRIGLLRASSRPAPSCTHDYPLILPVFPVSLSPSPCIHSSLCLLCLAFRFLEHHVQILELDFGLDLLALLNSIIQAGRSSLHKGAGLGSVVLVLVEERPLHLAILLQHRLLNKK